MIDVKNDETELDQFKGRVWTIAKKYAKLHSWCDEVDNALKEIGITEPTMVLVKVRTIIGDVDLRVQQSSIPADDLEQRKFFASIIGTIKVASTKITVDEDFIVDANLVLKDKTSLPYGEFEHWRFTSIEGRVRHYIGLNGPGQADCGVYFYGDGVVHSPRDTGGFCERCSKRAR